MQEGQQSRRRATLPVISPQVVQAGDWSSRPSPTTANMYTFVTPVLEGIAKDPAPPEHRPGPAEAEPQLHSQGPRQRY
jgi:hypothetical protein